MTESEADLTRWLCEKLREGAPTVVENWLDALRNRISTRSAQVLSETALKNHIPPVICSIADYVESPREAGRSTLLGQLRTHAKVRFDQGYDIQELLLEFDALAECIDAFVDEKLAERASPVGGRDLVKVFSRLTSGTRAIGFVTVGLYKETEDKQRSVVLEQLQTFADALTHEIRTPLQTIRLAGQNVRAIVGDSQTDTLDRNMTMMERALDRAQSLLEDIRILTSSTHGVREAHWDTLTSILMDVADEMRSAAERAQVRIDIDGAIPDLTADRSVTHLALINAVGNAIKYADRAREDRWVRVWVEEKRTESGPRILLSVQDNGVGIPADSVDQVFRRQFRAHPELAEGVGLGLTITKQVVEAAGGSIQLTSIEGKGTTLRFDLRAGPGERFDGEGDEVLERVVDQVGGDPSRSGNRSETPDES
ncbi:MAG: sensor histidine kinase [Myxococcota bacterium]